MAKEIILSNGTVTIVDDEDFERINEFRWYANSRGYVRRDIRIKGTHKKECILLHRLLLNCPDELYVDHIDGNILNNQKFNLRLCTLQQNSSNMKKHSNKVTSDYKGVGFDKSRNKWIANICFKGKRMNLGRFQIEIDAARAYNEAAKKYFGEFAKLNQIE